MCIVSFSAIRGGKAGKSGRHIPNGIPGGSSATRAVRRRNSPGRRRGCAALVSPCPRWWASAPRCACLSRARSTFLLLRSPATGFSDHNRGFPRHEGIALPLYRRSRDAPIRTCRVEKQIAPRPHRVSATVRPATKPGAVRWPAFAREAVFRQTRHAGGRLSKTVRPRLLDRESDTAASIPSNPRRELNPPQ